MIKWLTADSWTMHDVSHRLNDHDHQNQRNSNQVTIAAEQFKQALSRHIVENGQVRLIAHGQSMFPYIQQGDTCTFSVPNPRMVKKGDILLYQDSQGKFIAHRLLMLQKDAMGRPSYLIKGDTNLKPDLTVYPEQVIGILTEQTKFRHPVRLTHIFKVIWSPVVMHIPFISWYLHNYLRVRNRIRRMLRSRPL